MSDKATLLRDGHDAFNELRREIDGLSEAEMHEAWLGPWGVREILVHIAGWHEAMTPALRRIARGEAPYPPGTYDDADAWNARFVEAQRGVKVPTSLPGSTPRTGRSSPRRTRSRSRTTSRAERPGTCSTARARRTIASTRPRSGTGAGPPGNPAGALGSPTPAGPGPPPHWRSERPWGIVPVTQPGPRGGRGVRPPSAAPCEEVPDHDHEIRGVGTAGGRARPVEPGDRPGEGAALDRDRGDGRRLLPARRRHRQRAVEERARDVRDRGGDGRLGRQPEAGRERQALPRP